MICMREDTAKVGSKQFVDQVITKRIINFYTDVSRNIMQISSGRTFVLIKRLLIL